METIQQIANIEELLNYISSQGFSIIEEESDYFTVQCPRDASVTVQYEEDDTIEVIVNETLAQFENFDADEEFTELWSKEFADHNHFSPNQFINMLQEDEASLRELAGELREVVRKQNIKYKYL